MIGFSCLCHKIYPQPEKQSGISIHIVMSKLLTYKFITDVFLPLIFLEQKGQCYN